MSTYKIIANGTEMGTYTANTESGAILAYVQDAGYDTVAEAAAVGSQTEEEFLSEIEAVEVSYPIAITDYNSAGIQAEAEKAGITHMRQIGEGSFGDAVVRVFAMYSPELGGEVRVADTNADPVWEEDDPEVFESLLEECGIEVEK